MRTIFPQWSRLFLDVGHITLGVPVKQLSYKLHFASSDYDCRYRVSLCALLSAVPYSI